MTGKKKRQRQAVLRQERVTYLRNDDRGLTLIELLVSVAILAVIVVPCLSVFVTSARINAKTRESATAIGYATSILEELRGMSISEITEEFGGKEISAEPDGSTADYMYFTEYPLDNNSYIGSRKVKSMKLLLSIDRVSGNDEEAAASDTVTPEGITLSPPVLYRVKVTFYDRTAEPETLRDAKKRAELTSEIVK